MTLWNEAWTTVGQELSDVPNVSEVVRAGVRLLVAASLGAVLGYERESAHAAAGLRTHMLVSVGAALFVVTPLLAGMSVGDLSRVLQGLIAGIGFIGAGAIMKLSGEKEIVGLTTAASVWVTAAVGVAAGMGQETTAIFSTVFALFILSALRRFKL